MKIVLDTNVVLDVLTDRKPFAAASAKVMTMAESAAVRAAITANTITDVAYLLRKHLGDKEAVKTALHGLLNVLEVLTVTGEDCARALELPMPDYEDALLAECARTWEADYIITRDPKGFAKSPVRAVSPEAYLKLS